MNPVNWFCGPSSLSVSDISNSIFFLMSMVAFNSSWLVTSFFDISGLLIPAFLYFGVKGSMHTWEHRFMREG